MAYPNFLTVELRGIFWGLDSKMSKLPPLKPLFVQSSKQNLAYLLCTSFSHSVCTVIAAAVLCQSFPAIIKVNKSVVYSPCRQLNILRTVIWPSTRMPVSAQPAQKITAFPMLLLASCAFYYMFPASSHVTGAAMVGPWRVCCSNMTVWHSIQFKQKST